VHVKTCYLCKPEHVSELPVLSPSRRAASFSCTFFLRAKIRCSRDAAADSILPYLPLRLPFGVLLTTAAWSSFCKEGDSRRVSSSCTVQPRHVSPPLALLLALPLQEPYRQQIL
jgi:hypothetical protein